MKLNFLQAVIKILKEEDRPMTIEELTNAMNNRRYYRNPSGHPFSQEFVSSKTRDFPTLLHRMYDVVSLVKK